MATKDELEVQVKELEREVSDRKKEIEGRKEETARVAGELTDMTQQRDACSASSQELQEKYDSAGEDIVRLTQERDAAGAGDTQGEGDNDLGTLGSVLAADPDSRRYTLLVIEGDPGWPDALDPHDEFDGEAFVMEWEAAGIEIPWPAGKTAVEAMTDWLDERAPFDAPIEAAVSDEEAAVVRAKLEKIVALKDVNNANSQQQATAGAEILKLLG